MNSGLRSEGIGENDIRGNWFENNQCWVENGDPSDGVYAVARCCDFSAFQFSCNVYESEVSQYCNGCKSHSTCPNNEHLMGWYDNQFLHYI